MAPVRGADTRRSPPVPDPLPAERGSSNCRISIAGEDPRRRCTTLSPGGQSPGGQSGRRGAAGTSHRQ
ncbi:unnamed protein product [Nesidiocoris tenuis]|uniref:Uncharacterized protein n=1 Tax=Nesidiocoris tenuis TaxID=355587 RepID=A0A6H5FXY5_9HEMI|nr:unnamed protein product [Nesidiocoris tenuis]CAA9994283.1 unnamed protein product [Nesidiocoris tenuis]